MRMIVPIDVTDAVLVDCNIPETDHAAWSAATTYNAGDRVIVVATHSIYESVAASNLNHDPVVDSALAEPLWWVRVGATNRWKAFDGVIQDKAELSGGITYELDVPSRADGIALFGLDASSVTVQVIDTTTARRNLFIATEDLADAAWIKVAATDNGLVAGPTGAMDARSFTFTNVVGGVYQDFLPELSGAFTLSFKARSDDLTEIRLFSSVGDTVTISNEWTSVSMAVTLSVVQFVGFGCPPTGTGTVEICDLQIEVGALTEYQPIDAAGVWSLITYDVTRDLQDYSDIDDYWDYVFSPIIKLDAIIFQGVPAYAGTTLIISVNSTGVAKVGEIALGYDVVLGESLADAKIGMQDFSRDETDVFGNLKTIVRGYADTMQVPFGFPANRAAYIRSTLASRRAQPTVYHSGAGTEEYGLLTYGRYVGVELPINTTLEDGISQTTIEIKGLV